MEWTNSDLHHAINSTPSEDELSDLLEDNERILQREETEILLRYFEIKQGILEDLEECLLFASCFPDGNVGFKNESYGNARKAMYAEKQRAVAETRQAIKNARRRKSAILAYVLNKEGYDCRIPQFDPD